mmetsp:Transcript_42410/g.91094  ORF Transcript_42410/g.91094 Transcript_42410/m.91094 type:complete len:231 (+) Transcript_42410:50-742(+)
MVVQALALPIRYRNYYISSSRSNRWTQKPAAVTFQALWVLLSSSLVVVTGLTGASNLILPRGGQGIAANTAAPGVSLQVAEFREDGVSGGISMDAHDSDLRKRSDALAADEEQAPHGLVAALEDARSAEAALSAENEILREELARWQEAGLRVADREARAVEALHQKGHGAPVALLASSSSSSVFIPSSSSAAASVGKGLNASFLASMCLAPLVLPACNCSKCGTRFRCC